MVSRPIVLSTHCVVGKSAGFTASLGPHFLSILACLHHWFRVYCSQHHRSSALPLANALFWLLFDCLLQTISNYTPPLQPYKQLFVPIFYLKAPECLLLSLRTIWRMNARKHIKFSKSCPHYWKNKCWQEKLKSFKFQLEMVCRIWMTDISFPETARLYGARGGIDLSFIWGKDSKSKLEKRNLVIYLIHCS